MIKTTNDSECSDTGESKSVHHPDSKSKKSGLAGFTVSNSYTRVLEIPMISSLFEGFGKIAIVVASFVLMLFCLGVAQRSGWLVSVSTVDSKLDPAAVPQRYICPMMCTPATSNPGRCAVCAMELVAATSDASGDGISITIDAHARRIAGITTAPVKREIVTRSIATVGTIAFDESRLATISAHSDGRLEKLYANYIGVPVSEGDNLALIYSPQIYTAQAEYLAGLKENLLDSVLSSQNGLAEMARVKLVELGMTEAQIDSLRSRGEPESRTQVKSSLTGTVIEKNALEGDYVKTGDAIFRIADLSTVWLMLDLFPADAALIRFGQIVEAEIQSVKGEVFTGRVAFIEPTVNTKTKTVRVRVEVLNLEGELRPGDFATARISIPAVSAEQVYDPELADKFISPMHPQLIRDQAGSCPLCGMDLIPTSDLGFASHPIPDQEVITVPRNAVLVAGDNAVLYVESDPGRFEIRQVSLGVMTQEHAVIMEGLEEGEIVALDGNFLIDSQMQLIGNPSLIDPDRAPRFPSEPLVLPDKTPMILSGESGTHLDAVYSIYFEMVKSLAEDRAPSAVNLNTLIEMFSALEQSPDITDVGRRHLAAARRAASRLEGSMEQWRSQFRMVSHSLLRLAAEIRGPITSKS
ncbi:efflux RND transporter periplasmic adaptor subunit, partial [bacterium]|nr:efflux RND transporter periplasmic adaptor subunit [bacterium]